MEGRGRAGEGVGGRVTWGACRCSRALAGMSNTQPRHHAHTCAMRLARSLALLQPFLPTTSPFTSCAATWTIDEWLSISSNFLASLFIVCFFI